MKRLIIIFCLIFTVNASAQKSLKAEIGFDLDSQSVSQILRVVYIEAYRERPYFLDPALLQDQRLISFRYSTKNGDFRSFFTTFLRELGYLIESKNGADFIRSFPVSEKPSIVENSDIDVFYYRPKFRDGSYLVEVLTPLFNGKFTSQRAVTSGGSPSLGSALGSLNSGGSGSSSSPVAPSGSALAQVDRSIDQLLFYGSSKEVAVLKKLLSQVDTDIGQVLVTGVVYEVQTGDHKGSALSLAGSLLSGKLNFNFGLVSSSNNFLNVKLADIQAIIQALDSDSRFKVLSSPQVRVSSGKSASFIVGEEVPVLGSITYPQGASAPVQSVDYRSSGVIFSINPDVHDSAIDLKVDQQVSSFVNTSTGVNNSPTLIKRQLSTSVSMSDGDVVVIGGLKQNKDSAGSSGLSFLSSFFKAKQSDSSSTEILLFLQLKRL